MSKLFLKKIYFNLQRVLYSKKYMNNIKNSNSLVILNLHKVSPNNTIFYPSLHPELFDALLKFVTKEFNVITFGEIENYRNSTKPNLILSFDDGFYDFKEYALSILDKYKVKANQNVVPYSIESGKPVWDVMLGDFLEVVSIDTVNALTFPDFNLKLTHKNGGYFALALTKYLKELKKEQRVLLWQQIEDIINEREIPLTKMLSKDDIKEIAKVYEIGCHSFSHESMAIEDNDFFEEDFFKCKEYFRNQLELPLDIYAFPSGSYKEEQLEFLEKNGVKEILLVNEAYSNYSTNRHNRFTFYGNSVSEIELRALGWRR